MRLGTAVFLIATAAHAAGKAKRPVQQLPPEAAPTVAAPRAAAVVVDAAATDEQLLESARGCFSSLEYDRAVPYTEALLARDTASVNQRVEAYFLLASARAFVTDPLEAERPLRFLLRLKPDFEVPAETSPKLVAVFRKVQVEERAFAAQTRALERARVVSAVRVTGGTSEHPRGGQPLTWRYRVTDPAGVVAAVRVPYRLAASGPFSTLALEKDGSGDWVASLGGEVTANDEGLQVQYYIETNDGESVLTTHGGPDLPLAVSVEPGRLTRAFKPLSRPVFFVSLALTLGAGAASGFAGGLLFDAQARYRAMTLMSGVDGASLNVLKAEGKSDALWTTALLITTVSLAVVSVVLALLVDWDG